MGGFAPARGVHSPLTCIVVSGGSIASGGSDTCHADGKPAACPSSNTAPQSGARHTLFSLPVGVTCPDGQIWDGLFDSCEPESASGGVDGNPSGGPGSGANVCNPVTGQGNNGYQCPSPKPSATPNCALTGNAGIDSIVKSDKNVLTAMTTLSNLGQKPTIVDTTNAPGTVAMYYASTNTIDWDQAQANWAVANDGQQMGQILFHELDHDYLDHSSGIWMPNSDVSIQVGDYTITYNLNTWQGQNAYMHALVNNDIVTAYGVDDTAAIEQAFGYNAVTPAAVNPGVTVKDSQGKVVTGTPLKTAADKNRSTKLSTPINPPKPLASAEAASGAACKGAPASPSALNPTVVGYFQTGAQT